MKSKGKGKKKVWVGYFAKEYAPMMAFKWSPLKDEFGFAPNEILETFSYITKKNEPKLGLKKIRITVEEL